MEYLYLHLLANTYLVSKDSVQSFEGDFICVTGHINCIEISVFLSENQMNKLNDQNEMHCRK